GDAPAGGPPAPAGEEAAGAGRARVREQPVPPADARGGEGEARADPPDRGLEARPPHHPRRADAGPGGEGPPPGHAGTAGGRRGSLAPAERDVGSHAASRARRARRLEVDRRVLVLRLPRVRRAAEGPRVLRVLLRDVHRLLGRALRLREDGLPRAP